MTLPVKIARGARTAGVACGAKLRLARAFLVFLAIQGVALAAASDVGEEARIDAILATLTLEQKVAQMIQPEIRDVSVEDQRRYGFGSVLNGGGSFPGGDKHASPGDWLALADAFYDASLDRSQGSAGIPVIWGTDAVHGHNNVYGATLFPHNIALGATFNPALAGLIAEATAREVRAAGQDWIFAPTVAVAVDPRWGRTYESFSSQPDLVTSFVAPVVEGLQSQQTIATAKHFIGDGGTRRGEDQGDTVLPLDELLRIHGPGYEAAIEAGVLTIMASFSSWNGQKVHGSRQLLTEVLKEDMGFDGVVVSDWNGIGQVRYCSNDDCAQAINAGIDMVMVPEEWKAFLDTTVQQVRDDVIPQARIDDAVRRILRVKLRAGLLDDPRPPSARAAEQPVGTIGAPAHRALAADAVRQSLVLLKNNDELLPLTPTADILVAGSVANDIARQSGGWTLSWQGTGNSQEDFPGATSIFQGIQQHVMSGGRVRLRPDGAYEEKPDVAVVVFGEEPYAEGVGDVAHLSHSARYPEDLALMRRLQENGVPVVGVFITGRPAWTNPELNASDAFVVAWLPGSEGDAVADVLFASPGGEYDFRGQLPMPWPAHDADPAGAADAVPAALFPVGYGLQLTDRISIDPALDETAHGEASPVEEVLFDRRSQPPWSMMIVDGKGRPQRVRAPRTLSADRQLGVEVRDYQVQEDARRLRWSPATGTDPRPAVQWQHVDGKVTDLQDSFPDPAVVALHLRVHDKPAAPVELEMRCGDGCAGAVDVTDILQQAPASSWFDVQIPLRCFRERGVDLGRVTIPLFIRSAGALDMTIADVRIREIRAGDSPRVCTDASKATREHS